MGKVVGRNVAVRLCVRVSLPYPFHTMFAGLDCVSF